MGKLLWVLAPLAAAALAVAAWAWRRGAWPSRQALNVGLSLVLLGYVLATAGLGIFWVANQQLPAFDWHYLFGYTTVSLLVAHLGFNFHVVWRFLRRRAGASPAGATAVRDVQRRPLVGALGLAGMAVAGGIGYAFGWRHGRIELRIDAGGTALGGGSSAGRGTPTEPPAARTVAAGAAPAAAWAVVERFHALSSQSRTGVLQRAPGRAWRAPPPPFKPYPGATRLALPPPLQRQPATPTGADLASLGTLLWHGAGVSLVRGGIHFRTAPSAGALFATELYVWVRRIAGVAPGWWHYDARTHALQMLQTPGASGGEAATARQLGLDPDEVPAAAQAVLIATAVYARSGTKYGERTYRYLLVDLGHVLANLDAAAAALGARVAWLRAFDEQPVADALSLDAATEGVLALAPVGWPADAAAVPPPQPARWEAAGFALDAAAAAHDLTAAVHRATSLRRRMPPPDAASAVPGAGSGPADASGAALARATPQAARTDARPLPAPMPQPPDALAAMAARRSTRRYAGGALAPQALGDVLAAMTRPPPVLSDAVRVHVLTTAVQGLDAAAWRYVPGAHALVPGVAHGTALRRRARAAALDQDVIGDAAAVVVLALDRAVLATDALGAARAWRHGLIEAGMLSERLYLAAGALGLGACAVGAFYDDEAAALVGVDPAAAWVVHFAALGVPA